MYNVGQPDSLQCMSNQENRRLLISAAFAARETSTYKHQISKDCKLPKHYWEPKLIPFCAMNDRTRSSDSLEGADNNRHACIQGVCPLSFIVIYQAPGAAEA